MATAQSLFVFYSNHYWGSFAKTLIIEAVDIACNNIWVEKALNFSQRKLNENGKEWKNMPPVWPDGGIKRCPKLHIKEPQQF